MPSISRLHPSSGDQPSPVRTSETFSSSASRPVLLSAIRRIRRLGIPCQLFEAEPALERCLGDKALFFALCLVSSPIGFELVSSGPEALGLFCGPPLAPPVILGLIGDARVAGAIWSLAWQFLGAAEAKFRLGRIADRPTAHRLAQFRNGHGFGYRHHNVPHLLGRGSFNHE